jgi:hypothetical protein
MIKMIMNKLCVDCEKKEWEHKLWECYICNECYDTFYSTCDSCWEIMHKEDIVSRDVWPDMCVYCLD